MSEASSPKRVTRRTVAKGAAWTVPAIVVAAPAASAATSGVEPPVINFGTACGNTGATQKGCGGEKTLQVPLTLTNLSGADVYFQITSMYTCNGCGVAPTAATPGAAAGIRGIWVTPSHAEANEANCSLPTVPDPTCAGGAPLVGGVVGQSSTIVVPTGTDGGTYWIESAPNGDSSDFWARIGWRLLNADCSVIDQGEASTDEVIPNNNCNG